MIRMKICAKCKKENRDQARFCRFCGERISRAEVTVVDDLPQGDDLSDDLDDLIGLETPKKEIREMVLTIKNIMKQRGKSVLNSMNMNVLITGPSGSGKTCLLFELSNYMCRNGIFKKEEGVIFTPLTIDSLNLTEQPLKAIVLDDAHKLLPPNKEDDITGTPLEYIFENARLSKLSGDDYLILIMSGSQEFQDYVGTVV